MVTEMENSYIYIPTKARQTWKNLRICKVEDAVTLWVREVPSDCQSRGFVEFQHMEAQMNNYFKNRIKEHNVFLPPARPGDLVVVHHSGKWFRGEVESVSDSKTHPKTSVFLLDYGTTVEADCLSVVCLPRGQWTSTPYQARRIHLFAVAPVSLQYAVIAQNFKVTPKESKEWDPSAKDFIQQIVWLEPAVEFVPVLYGPDGCLHGSLTVYLTENYWSAVPLLSSVRCTPPQQGTLAVDLAKILVDCKFAAWKMETLMEEMRESEEMEDLKENTAHEKEAHLVSPRKLDIKYEPESQDTGRLCVASETRPSARALASPSRAAGTSQSLSPGGADTVKGIQGEPGLVPCSRGRGQALLRQLDKVLSKQLPSVGSRSSNSSIASGSSCESLSSTQGLSNSFTQPAVVHKTESCTPPNYDRFSGSDFKTIPSPVFGTNVLPTRVKKPDIGDETCNHTELQLSSVTEKDTTGASVAGEKSNSFSFDSPFSASTSASRSPALNGPTRLPQVNDGQVKVSVHSKETEPLSEDETVPFEGELIINQLHEKTMKVTENRAEVERGNTKILVVEEYSKSRPEPQHSSSLFMSDNRDIWTSEQRCDLEEGELVPQLLDGTVTEGPNIAKLLRVFVAGETPVVEDEVLVNEDMTSATLNPHVFEALKNEGWRATPLQAYCWPVITRGSSTVVVGAKASGKTMGYAVPLMSTIMDTWQHISRRLAPGIGAVMVVMCSSWRKAKCVADYLVGLLSPDITLKIITAWGGCGHEEEKDTKTHLLGGCDILITTAPCLLRLITGHSTDKDQNGDTQTRVPPSTSLTRCCHLVVDDADSVLESFPAEVKQILTLWGEGRRGNGREDLEQQLVLVSSRWTDMLDSLTHSLISLVDPTVIISAPCEAAVAAKVATHVHLMSTEDDVLTEIIAYIKDASSDQRNLVFVKDDSVAGKLKSMLDAFSLYSVIVCSTVTMWNLKLIVQEWHNTSGITMIVCESAEDYLVRQDLSNAQVIFHSCIPSLPRFKFRYAFMIDNFSSDLKKRSNCEAYVIVSKATLSAVPDIVHELRKLCSHFPEEVSAATLCVDDQNKDLGCDAVCYFLKAYGRCPVKSVCDFRHEFKLSDIPKTLPRAGEITFSVVQVYNASRYVVRINKYRKETGEAWVDLKSNYLKLFLALQHYFGDPDKRESVEVAEPGMLCALEDKEIWYRAKVVRVSYYRNTPLAIVMLVDEGKEMSVETGCLKSLPTYLAAVPEMIVEVYICRLQPVDQDREWTHQASQYIHETFICNRNSEFRGTIVLALGLTLWLSPVVEYTKFSKTLVQKPSLRGRLIKRGFGVDNSTHLDTLNSLCAEACISLSHEDLHQDDWHHILEKAVNVLDDSQKQNKCSKSALNGDEQEESDQISDALSDAHPEESFDSFVILQDSKFSSKSRENGKSFHSSASSIASGRVGTKCQDEAVVPSADIASTKFTEGEKVTHTSDTDLLRESLPLGAEVKVEIGEIESPSRFYVLRDDKLADLEKLEMELEKYIQHKPSSENPDAEGGEDTNSCIPRGSCCIAKFTDDGYYRGWVKSCEDSDSKSVYFVDHGETLRIPNEEVHPCPARLIEMLPAQAIMCTLDHITVPDDMEQQAATVMTQIVDTPAVWTLKVTKIQEACDGIMHTVELKDTSCILPVEMWKKVVDAGVAVHINQDKETESPSSELLDASVLDEKEAADFLLGVPQFRALVDQKRDENATVERDTPPPSETSGLLMDHSTNTDISVVSSQNSARQNITSADTSVGSVDSCGSSSENSERNNFSETVDKKDQTLTEIPVGQFQNQHVKPGSGLDSQKSNASNKPHKRHLSHEAFQKLCIVVPPLQAVEGVTPQLCPDVSWSQTNNSVNVHIHLMGVELYKCRFGTTRLTFLTVMEERYYVLDETLAHTIDPDHSAIHVRGTRVSVTLRKATEKKWERLVASRERRPWLRVECQSLLSDLSSESEDDDGGWCTSDVESQKAARGGLPAGLSDSEVSCDGLSDGEELFVQ